MRAFWAALAAIAIVAAVAALVFYDTSFSSADRFSSENTRLSDE